MLGEPQEECISKEEVLEMIDSGLNDVKAGRTSSAREVLEELRLRPERCWRNFVMNYRLEASATFKRNIRNLGKRYASIVVD